MYILMTLVLTVSCRFVVFEGTERLTGAIDGKKDDMLQARALLESGNKLLKDCRNELENIHKTLQSQDHGQHQPSKSAK